MTGKQLKEALHSGRRVYGTWVASPSPVWANAIKYVGLDYVFIDTEHVPLDRPTLSWMCQTYRALDLTPIVRIPQPDPYQACMALDAGAVGVQAPYIETAQEVEALREAVKLNPWKGKDAHDFAAGRTRAESPAAEYLAERNQGKLLLLTIESRPALEPLDEILGVPEVDGVIVGPHDLSVSLGIPEQYHHPAFEAAVAKIIGACRDRKIGVGVHGWDIEQEARWAEMGANILFHSGDIMIVLHHLRNEIELLRKKLGDPVSLADGPELAF